MGCPMGHRVKVPTHVSGHDVLLASQHPNEDVLEHPLSQVSGWGGMVASPISWKNGQLCSMKFKTLSSAIDKSKTVIDQHE